MATKPPRHTWPGQKFIVLVYIYSTHSEIAVAGAGGRSMKYQTFFMAGATAIVLSMPAVQAREVVREPVRTSTHFAFYSDFATNLNDALITTGKNRNDGKPEMFQLDAGRECISALPPSAREGWNLAVDYYARVISPVEWNDRQQFLLRQDLAGTGPDLDARAQRFADMAEHFRALTTTVYGECQWREQDAKNREWIFMLDTRVDLHGAAISRKLENLYGTPWHGLPLRVDLVPFALPHGANSIYLTPEGGHLLVSDSIDERHALEIIFHEASHTIAASGRKDPAQDDRERT
jgi:hypothetical protein